MCVGGLLSLDIVMRGHSVRLGVLEPLRPDVFVAGTLNATRDEMADGADIAQDGSVDAGADVVAETAEKVATGLDTHAAMFSPL